MKSVISATLRITNRSFICAIFLFYLQLGVSQHTDKYFSVEPTPALGLIDQDLTTVLLVNNNNLSEARGRILNVHPSVGILTSTARTFIQEGVTTEYATQVLGTTLENGRLYAQLIKKSSRVLYDTEHSIMPSQSIGGVVHTSIVGEIPIHQFIQPKSLLQSHNDLVADKDWQDVDDRIILENNSFVGNTDFVGINSRALQNSSDEIRGLAKQSKGSKYEGNLFNTSSKNMNYKNDYEINASKVELSMDLSTVTIKNLFSPSGFSWESTLSEVKSKTNSHTTPRILSSERSAKLLYQQMMKKNHRPLSTITYYGFADFTTVVGDSVIVFSPSTSSHLTRLGYVTSIKGAATLGLIDSSHVILSINQDLIKPTSFPETLSMIVNNLQIKSTSISREDTPESSTIQVSSIKTPQTTRQISLETIVTENVATSLSLDKEDQEPEANGITTPSSIIDEDFFTTVNSVNGDELNKIDSVILLSSMPDIILASSSITPRYTPGESQPHVLLTKPTNEEILKIYSSLANLEKPPRMKDFLASNITDSTTNVNDLRNLTRTVIDSSVESNIKIQGGATTIFFEDDTFPGFVLSSSTENVIQQATQMSSVIQDYDQMQTTTEIPEATTEFVTEPDSETEPTTDIDTEGKENINEQNDNSNETEDKERRIGTYFQPIVKEITENEQIEGCIRTSQVFLTQIPKTVTLFETKLINDKENPSVITTFVETKVIPSFNIAEATKYYCIQSTPILHVVQDSHSPTIEELSNPEIDRNIKEGADLYEQQTENTSNITEEPNVSADSIGVNYEDDDNFDLDDEDEEMDNEEELEIIYKTLYTTYTYLTTFFQTSTTSISSRKEVVTNIITSSLGADKESLISHEPIKSSQLPESSIEISPTLINTGIGRPTTQFLVQSSDLQMIDGILRKASDSIEETKSLDEPNQAKTYYTTYTYYTTIFVDGETEIMSRTEIYTNILGTPSDSGVSPTARNFDNNYAVFDENNAVIDVQPTSTYDTILRTMKTLSLAENNSEYESNYLDYKTINRATQNNQLMSSNPPSYIKENVIPEETDLIRLVTDIRSSSSNGLNQIIENGFLDDQISSESNTDEIIPSATLLLQTSYTTFTYYTTMYSKDVVSVMSRLETVTNVVTETLQSTKTINVEAATLPVTYFTTFTYWTKLAKEGEIITLSHEETLSNVITPTPKLGSDPINTISSNQVTASAVDHEEFLHSESKVAALQSDIDPTTYYTTFTYYTTSYAGESTITNSRFETVTNVIYPNQTKSETEREFDLNSIVSKSEITDESSIAEILSTLAYDYKTIVDPDEISTLYYTSELLATVINGVTTQVELSSSSMNIDEERKAILSTTPTEDTESTRTYKTGLVRLIKGTQLSNQTTTVYQSKVIGTIINQRYAQIIESTSSFIIGKTKSVQLSEGPEIQATSTLPPYLIEQTTYIPPPTEKAIESSINENSKEAYDDQDDNIDNENKQLVNRLSFQSKKKTFTPIIRPFASRSRPQFAPKRKNIQPSSATIITRSDFTPTITATPALKSETRSRFISSRKSSEGNFTSAFGTSNIPGNKRFGRPSKSSQFGGIGSSNYPGSSRNRLQTSKIPTISSFAGFQSSRRGGFRVSTTNARLLTSASAGISKLRIRPSNSGLYDNVQLQTTSFTTSAQEIEEENFTENYESEEEIEITTENTRRNNNPLLRFRRPPISRAPFAAGPRNISGNQNLGRRNTLVSKPRTTTVSATSTTVRPRPRAFQRPPIGQLQARSRLQSNLFPSRRIPAQNVNQDLDEYQKATDVSSENTNEEIDLNDFEGDQVIGEDQDEQNRRRRESHSFFPKNRRSKRQADFSVRSSFRNRFRRPSTGKPAAEERVENLTELESSTPKPRTSSRFTPRTYSLPAPTHSSNHNKSHGNGRTIRPTKPSSNNRPQFTLREKDTTLKHPSRHMSNFKRPSTSGVSARRTSTISPRPKAPRLKSFGSSVTETTHSGPRSRSSTSRTRSTSRGRSRNDFTTDESIPIFDGSLTVTHTTPIEVTIPIINGKVTEYKNVLTTTTSTEIILPNQFTSIIGPNGISTLVLSKEESSVSPNGVTEITQFILQESLTKATIFTPTSIRGRKTSFAHVIPSTAYQVKNVVSTVQPNLVANAPLANILLSQILLGNIGLNQPNINPLLALGATQQISQTTGNPTTEYKTRTSTYVTTVTNAMSTVIPLTFHGKEILTTIFDSSSKVITATEFFTDTIVVTPTQIAQAQQVNSLLLPLLLQQQLQGHSQSLLPLQNTVPPQLHLSDNLQELDNGGGQQFNDYTEQFGDIPTIKEELFEAPPQNAYNTKSIKNTGGRKHGRKQNRQSANSVSYESSVITLYVSGRRPGEFSTVLSTVQIGGDSSLHKRQVNHQHPVLKSKTADYDDFYKSDESEIQEYLLPATNDVTSSHSLRDNFLSEETQSLESIVGDVDLWYAKTSAQLEHPPHEDISTIYQVVRTTKNKINPISLSTKTGQSSVTNYFLV